MLALKRIFLVMICSLCFIGGAISINAQAAEVGGVSSAPKAGLEKGYTPVFNGEGLKGGIDASKVKITGVYKEKSIIKLIAGWVRFALPIIAFATFVVILVAGWFFVTAGGDDGRHDAAKKTLIWAIVGLIIVMGAYAIVNTYLGGIVG